MAPTPRDEDPPMGLFAEASAVSATDVEGVWAADIRDELTIVRGHPNGGYLLALLGRAGVAALGDPSRHVVAATATYVAPPTVGPAEVHTTVLRRGRTASQVRAALVQDGTTTVDSVLTVAVLDDAPVDWGGSAPPEMPDIETCRASGSRVGSSLTPSEAPPLTRVLRTDFDPDVLGFAAGAPSGRGELRAWLSLVDGTDWDPASLLFAIDALPPATFEVAITGWVPTLTLTAYLLAAPAPGPLRARFRAGTIAGGRVDEVCEVWDSTDRMVATSTQLAAIRLTE